MPEETEDKKEFIVEVEVSGHWTERYSVKATSEDEAMDNWHDGEYIEAYNYDSYDHEPTECYEY